MPDHEHVTTMATLTQAVKQSNGEMLARLREAADIAKNALRERNQYFKELCELRTLIRTSPQVFGRAIVRMKDVRD